MNVHDPTQQDGFLYRLIPKVGCWEYHKNYAREIRCLEKIENSLYFSKKIKEVLLGVKLSSELL